MVKCIIFDIGNVLLDFKPMEHLEAVFTKEKDLIELYNQIFLSKEWIELDRGTLTQEEFTDIICLRHPMNSELIRQVMKSWVDMLTPKGDTLEIIERIDFNKYKVLLLSNFHKFAYEYITEKYEFFKRFHGGIISYKEKLVKPNKDIFECLIKRHDFLPEEAIFIDDTYDNVEAAAKLGFNIIHFKSAVQLKEELEMFGVSLI